MLCVTTISLFKTETYNLLEVRISIFINKEETESMTLSIFDNELSDKFNGLHTTFGLYEIAPYSEGIVEVFVPWKSLK